MHIQMLSTGCSKSAAQLENIETAVRTKGLNAKVETVNDIYKIMSYGISCCPAIVIDGKLKSAGKLLSAEEVLQLIG